MKKSIYIFLIFILIAPVFQGQFQLINEKNLGGYSTETNRFPQLNKQFWLDNSFQDQTSKYLKNTFGFRKSLIRLKNQIEYSFFNKSNTAKVVVGKSGVLYEDYYIDGYFGRDYVGGESIKNNVKALKELFTKLNSVGVNTVLVIAPGKASFFPRDFPEEFEYGDRKETNYSKTVHELKQQNIPYLDLKRYFLDIKETTYAPLFPKQGIHWSSYGSILAADTMLKYIESQTKLNLTNILIDKGEWTNQYKGTDYDIGKSLNLINKNNDESLYYPTVRFNSSGKIKALIIGDSFSNSFYNTYPVFQNAFDSTSNFWYYNQQVLWPENIEFSSLNKFDKIIKSKVVLIIFNEQNLGNLCYGFARKTNDYFTKKGTLFTSVHDSYKNEIYNSPDWLNTIKVKSEKNGQPLSKAVSEDAKWMCKQYFKPFYVDSIYRDSAWFNEIKLKAKNQNISVNKMIDMDVNYILDLHLSHIKEDIVKEEVQRQIKKIKMDSEWYNSIVEKAKLNNIPIDEQLSADAKWIIENAK